MTDSISGLLDLGAEKRNGDYWLTVSQLAVLLPQIPQENLLAVFYDPIDRQWFPCVPDASIDGFVSAINAAVRKRLQSTTYDYEEFQLVVCGRYPGIEKFSNESNIFCADGQHIRIQYHPSSGTWDTQKVISKKSSTGSTLAEAIQNLKRGDCPC